MKTRGVSASDSLALADSVRRRLGAAFLARALLVGTGAAMAVWMLGVLALGPVGPRTTRDTVVIATLALLAGVAAGAVVRRRSGRVSLVRAALWIEERTPAGYALVTLAESASGGYALDGATRNALDDSAASQVHARVVLPATRALRKRLLLGPALFLAGALAVLLVSSRFGDAGTQQPRGSVPGSPAATAAATLPLGAWRVRVTPPPYSGLPVASYGDVNGVRALAGSRVELTGSGTAPSVALRVIDVAATTGAGGASRAAADVRADAGGWRVGLAVPGAPLELRLSRGGATRLLLVEAFGDSLPRVVLRLPARDSVLRRAEGRLAVEATTHDDLGLASGAFELIVSSGEGERFTARTVSVGAARLGGRRDATLGASLDLAALALGPGDIVHLRAVARDAHPSAGREAGSSETRSFRIARASEYDSVAVEPAPPPAVDSSLLSQRMLLMLTERLEKRRPGIARSVLVSESQRLARDQARLRLSVGSVVFQRLSGEQGAEHAHFAGDGHEHAVDQVGGKLALPGRDANGVLDEGDDSPIIAINRPLLEAYNAMWDAGRALEQAEPKAAIPHMRLALAAIERARAASRLYLRGKPPTVIVDLAKVRLTGKDTGSTNLRSTRDALPADDARRERRLLAAAAMLERDAAAARDSLALLRLESVGDAPLFAAALSAALDALQGARDMTPALLRARRTLGGVVRVPASGWSRGGIGSPP